eukprot:3237863-Alexandrium_andersonii.AAC.1
MSLTSHPAGVAPEPDHPQANVWTNFKSTGIGQAAAGAQLPQEAILSTLPDTSGHQDAENVK